MLSGLLCFIYDEIIERASKRVTYIVSDFQQIRRTVGDKKTTETMDVHPGQEQETR